MKIDVEGHEIEVLRSIDLNKYFPEMVVIEFLERDILENLEFHNQNIVKIAYDDNYKTIYTSRSPIPFSSSKEKNDSIC